MNPGPEAPQQDPAAASVETDVAAESERPRGGPSWLVLAGISLLVMLLVRGFLVQSFYVPSGSMEPTIEPGDRILVNKLVSGEDLSRGDVVVFDGTTSFAAAEREPHQDDGFIGRTLSGAASLVGVDLGEQDFVKRVIGLPGRPRRLLRRAGSAHRQRHAPGRALPARPVTGPATSPSTSPSPPAGCG